jgi:hypothetical protein
MTISIAPPPLSVPPEWAQDKEKGAFFGALVNTIYQLWTATYGLRYQNKVLTTDASVTAILRTPVTTNKTVMIVASIVARRTGGVAGTIGDSAWYRLSGAYKNIGGVLTGIGTPELVGGEDQAGWTVGFTTSGTDAVVTVQGAVDNNITWESSVSTYTVGA